MRTSDRKTQMVFEKKNTGFHIKRYDLKSVNYPVRVVSSEYDSQKDLAVFFVHGAPGSSDNYYTYLQDSLLLKGANLYSIDRPGYGFSNFGKPEISIKRQSEVVAEIIDSLPEQKVIVLGHSYGGPIAAYSSILSPKVKSVIMLAPALDPENEKFFGLLM
ncbi:alpha/beta fold hydrolase [Pseudotenacibaculum haliotis]|uniref:Alpha/beta fold hydrolase n=1 Tax=Pseudotenacibaculum haliotis TaxID=1862138 RepID=A0ABW5LPT7_9FLAO